MFDPTAWVADHGDLAHMALFLWASSVSALALFALRELAHVHRRYEDFVEEIRRITRRVGGGEG